MEKLTELRKKVFESTFRKLEENIADADFYVREAQQMANEYGPPKDRYDGFRMQLLRKRDIMAEKQQQALNDLELIKKISRERDNPAISLGAMVITENQKLFIATGVGKIEVDGEKWHVISPSAPIAKLLSGRKKGDIFEMNGQKTRIIEVF